MRVVGLMSVAAKALIAPIALKCPFFRFGSGLQIDAIKGTV